MATAMCRNPELSSMGQLIRKKMASGKGPGKRKGKGGSQKSEKQIFWTVSKRNDGSSRGQQGWTGNDGGGSKGRKKGDFGSSGKRVRNGKLTSPQEVCRNYRKKKKKNQPGGEWTLKTWRRNEKLPVSYKRKLP